jgi:hypothetical protein
MAQTSESAHPSDPKFGPERHRVRLPKSFYNPISLIGAGLALVTLGAIVIFFAMDVLGYTKSPYLGIFTYMLLPGVMITGLFLIPIGAWKERRRLRKSKGAERKYMVLDLNNPSQRLAAMIFTAGTMLLIVLSAAGTYQTYQYSESVEFCGKICHDVMSPEYTAYQHSPHARVLCAECHIGEGADWFVKAKISGSYQVYSVLFKKYARPIETPIQNLRPARETCEHCHWPQKFSATLDMTKNYFPLDTSAMKPWTITLQLKIGGGQSELGPTEGIHWHMNTENKIEYIAEDDKRQVIPWVKATSPNGGVKIFRSTENAVPDSVLSKKEKRTIDCIDCHNRPSHIYYPPFRTLNDAMAHGSISPALPNIRAIASHALTQKYSTNEEALESIPAFVRQQYQENAPDVLRAQAVPLQKAIDEILRQFQRNYFPFMRVDWRGYPNHIGHMYNDGCFRCHDNKHKTADGQVLTNDCTVCHTIVAQGPQGKVESDIRGLKFIHPVDVDGAEMNVRCTECHTGE